MKKFPRNNPQDGGDDDDPEDNRGDRKPSPPAQEVLVVRNRRRRRGREQQQQSSSVSSSYLEEAAGSSGASSSTSNTTATTASLWSSWISSPVARMPRPCSPERQSKSSAPTATPSTHPSLSSYRTPPPTSRRGCSIQKSSAAPPSLARATPYDNPSSTDADDWKPAAVDVTTTTGQNNNNNNDAITTTTTSLRALQRQLFLWMITTAIGLAVILYEILPAAALTAVLFLLVSTAMLYQSVTMNGRQWYRDTIVTGPGLAPLLPSWLGTQLLTQTTLHEYLTDPTMMLEYRHLLLYFLPLAPPQLQAALEQLTPAHRERLQRPGLAHLLPSAVDRVLFGQQQQQQPTVLDADHMSGTGPRRQLLLCDNDSEEEDDDSSSLGLDVTSNDLAGALSDPQADMLARRIGLPGATNEYNNVVTRSPHQEQQEDSNNNEDDFNREWDVLVNAVWDAAYGAVWNPVRDYAATRSGHWMRRAGMWSSVGVGAVVAAWTTTTPSAAQWATVVQRAAASLLRSSSASLAWLWRWPGSSARARQQQQQQPRRTWDELAVTPSLSSPFNTTATTTWLWWGAGTTVVGLSLLYARRTYYHSYSSDASSLSLGSASPQSKKESKDRHEQQE